MKNYTLGKKICIRAPKNPLLCNNGGDYFFYRTPILLDGMEVGEIFETSAEFSFCMASNSFADTVVLWCAELGRILEVRKTKWYNDDSYPDGITVEEFLELIYNITTKI